jgi:DNA-binding response OmpR family regulator
MKILIAEDDAVTRFVLTGTLEKLGHEVVAMENGHQAWAAFKNDHFPVLISDWLMPEMDGLSLCRHIRSVPQDKYTVIILLTSLGGKSNYLDAIYAGADDFMTKPFDEDQLAARLHVAERVLGLRRHVHHLEGLLPICAYCKKIRDDRNEWQEIESYVSRRTEARFTHSICPACSERYLASVVNQ